MKIGFYSAYDELNINNFIFRNANADIGDDLLKPFMTLNRDGYKYNIFIEVVSESLDKYDAFLLCDIPEKITKKHEEIFQSGKDIYLLLLESKHVLPKGYDIFLHRRFKKIFTWDDDLVDNIKYFKINYSFDFKDVKPYTDILNRKKNLVLISGNKKSKDKSELYSERKKIISYFDNLNSSFLDLYGIGWEYRAYSSKLMNFISSKFVIFKTYFYNPPKSYLGSVKRKREVLSDYRYSICFENRFGDRGYITEKIFDSMMAGTIPIYYGAINIENHIPKGCFIDYRKFNSITHLYNYLSNLSDEELLAYQVRINEFLSSDSSIKFSIGFFTKTILSHIHEGYISEDL